MAVSLHEDGWERVDLEVSKGAGGCGGVVHSVDRHPRTAVGQLLQPWKKLTASTAISCAEQDDLLARSI